MSELPYLPSTKNAWVGGEWGSKGKGGGTGGVRGEPNLYIRLETMKLVENPEFT